MNLNFEFTIASFPVILIYISIYQTLVSTHWNFCQTLFSNPWEASLSSPNEQHYHTTPLSCFLNRKTPFNRVSTCSVKNHSPSCIRNEIFCTNRRKCSRRIPKQALCAQHFKQFKRVVLLKNRGKANIWNSVYPILQWSWTQLVRRACKGGRLVLP